MFIRFGKRGAVRNSSHLTVCLVMLGLCLSVSGCGEDEESAIEKPALSEYEEERRALAKRQGKGPKRSRNPEKDGKGKGAKGGFSEGFEYAVGKDDYFYDPRDKRDPFRSIRVVNAEKQNKTFGPLGDFELVQLELSAVVWDASNPRALILDPGGRSYIIREGSAIGKHNGQVIHIGDSLVLVKETYEDFAGDRTTRDVELRIRMSQGG